MQPVAHSRKKKLVMFTLRWTIAAVGVWYVLHAMWFRDHVTVVTEGNNRPIELALASPAMEDSPTFKVWWTDGSAREVSRERVIRRVPEREKVKLKDGKEANVLGVTGEGNEIYPVLVQQPGSPPQWVNRDQVADAHYVPAFVRPRIEPGIISLVRRANALLLLAAILIFPITFLITSYRWHELLKVLDIRIGQARTFVLNMVGAFYNTFMPGSTGGDVLKAWYVAKHTTMRTRAVMSVLVDRMIGLLALIMVGGIAAGYQFVFGPANDPSRHACQRVAVASL